MAQLLEIPPLRRSDLVIRPIGENGDVVVKDPRSGGYFQLGEQEHFLLLQLDGESSALEVCVAFERRFGESLSEDDLEHFLELARSRRLVNSPIDAEPGARPDHAPATAVEDANRGPAATATSPPQPGQPRQTILYWRKSVFDPDRFFTWLAPKIRFFWTRGFLCVSGCSIAAAVWLAATGHEALVASVSGAWRWETIVLAWATLLVVTTLHEFAHGLTCKHYGGEVHEIGFLMMYFMPCFYCNVSDAWLFREKAKRLWVTLAGGYFELFLWSLAVFAWRLTPPGTVVHYLAFLVVSVSGFKSLLNFNPLLKLDGYYLLSDALEIPNLRQRGLERWQQHLRCRLWGGPAAPAEPKGRLLTCFGLVSWLFSLVFLTFMLIGMCRWLGANLGAAGAALVAVLGLVSARSMFQGISGGEVRRMLSGRRLRTAAWLGVLAAVPAALAWVEMEDRAGGAFQLRAAVRAEVRAPAAAFLRDVHARENEPVRQGDPLLQLEIPDLASRLAQKRAALEEAVAELGLLEAGARLEEIAAQKSRIESARRFRDAVQRELERSRDALQSQLASLESRIVQARAECEAAERQWTRIELLRAKNAAADEECDEARRRCRTAQAQWEQALAEKQALLARGVPSTESELAACEKELADLEAGLMLLEAGSRPEKVVAGKARVARLREELRHLEELQSRLVLTAPVSGMVATPRFREQVGKYFAEGDLILLVEDPSSVEAEVRLDEEAALRVRAGQTAVLRPRTAPLEKLPARVRRTPPAAEPGETNSRVTIDCTLDTSAPYLRPGMSGYARIETGRRTLGAILLDRLFRALRTEHWW